VENFHLGEPDLAKQVQLKEQRAGRVCLCGALAFGALVACSNLGRADEQAEVLKIVDAAIKAAGGEAKLDKLKIASMKGKGTLHQGGQEMGTFTLAGTVQGLDSVRLDFDANIMDRIERILIVIGGDKGWVKKGERVEDAPDFFRVSHGWSDLTCSSRSPSLPSVVRLLS
jgi:hypothetical protein